MYIKNYSVIETVLMFFFRGTTSDHVTCVGSHDVIIITERFCILYRKTQISFFSLE